MYFETVFGRMQ